MTGAELERDHPGGVAALCERARAELAGFDVDERALIDGFAAHATGGDAAQLLASCRAGELALAAGAARGARPAIDEIERRWGPMLDATCRRYARAEHGRDDLRQVLREKLFVGTAPAIAEYNGRGSLEGWLRVIATRALIDLGRRKDRAREALAPDELDRVATARDLELDALKAEYREAVAAALHAAAYALDAGDRHLLRQHLVAGLSIDQLGSALGIHRATAARRLARARELLAARTREHVVAALRLDDRELGEVFELVLSRLDVSMRTILATR